MRQDGGKCKYNEVTSQGVFYSSSKGKHAIVATAKKHWTM
jgi:hypothetical protein